jgi:hypothetical protein
MYLEGSIVFNDRYGEKLSFEFSITGLYRVISLETISNALHNRQPSSHPDSGS